MIPLYTLQILKFNFKMAETSLCPTQRGPGSLEWFKCYKSAYFDAFVSRNFAGHVQHYTLVVKVWIQSDAGDLILFFNKKVLKFFQHQMK